LLIGGGPSNPEDASMEFAAAVDQVIRENLTKLRKPGVLFIRPGYKSKGGKLTDDPAIVVTVANKRKGVPASERIPAKVGPYPTDVRQASAMHRLRAADPELYAEVADSAPPEMQRPIFPFERDATGQLVGPTLAAATAKVAARKPQKPKLQPTPSPVPLDPVSGQFTITCHASPDAGWPTLKPFIAGTQNRLTMAMYEFTAPYIVQAVATAVKQGSFALVLDDPHDPTKRDQTEVQTHDQLTQALGNSMTFAWALEADDPHVSAWVYPSAYHIKVVVRDGKAFWLSSGNLNRTNQPDIDPVKDPAAAKPIVPNCDRDWHVIVEHEGLAATFEKIIAQDLTIASKHQLQGVTSAGIQAAINTQAVASPQLAKVPKTYFAAERITGKMTLQPVLTPDNYAKAILPLIRGTKQTFIMQTQYITPPKATPSPGPSEGQSDQVLEALIAVVAELIKEGKSVRLIMSEFETQDKIELLRTRGIFQKNIEIQHKVHNKGMIIDDSIVVVGSQNWSGQGVSTNRDASLIIHNAGAAKYWRQIFDHDWKNMVEAGGLD
jgi:hypothetical protein